MVAAFTVRSQDNPGTDLGGWDSSGNVTIPGYIELVDISANPAPPPAGRVRLWSKGGQLTTQDGDGLPQLLAGAVGTSAVGTIASTTNAGASPTITVTDCTDQRGNFLLNPVTGGGGQTAGKVVTVKFSRAYSTAPGAVLVTMANETDSTAAIVAAVLAITTTGFDIYAGTALTTAKAYRVTYLVVP